MFQPFKRSKYFNVTGGVTFNLSCVASLSSAFQNAHINILRELIETTIFQSSFQNANINILREFIENASIQSSFQNANIDILRELIETAGLQSSFQNIDLFVIGVQTFDLIAAAALISSFQNANLGVIRDFIGTAALQSSFQNINLLFANQYIDATWVKDRFPDWQTFCTREDGLKTPDEMLNLAIQNSETAFLSFVSITDIDMTDELRLHLLNLIKYNCFNYLHGDTEFKHKPEIVMNYNRSLQKLKKALLYKGNDKLAAKEPEINTWFN